MDYITIDTLRKLQAVGFTYPEYEHFLNVGMLFFYNDDEYLIGGFCNDNFSEKDIEVAQQGVWLPESSQLLEWLKNTHFNVKITLNEEAYYSVQATDTINQSLYSGSGYPLANALAKVIIKICKSKQRAYIPEPTLRLHIEQEST